MDKKNRKGRIRQTRTDFQKVFDQHPGMLGNFSWHDRLFEVLHISIALVEYDYQTVKKDFYTISDYANDRYKLTGRSFHFNLSHAIRLAQDDPALIEVIRHTCFKEGFEQILIFYYELIELAPQGTKPKPELLLKGYDQILNGRSETSILCKYLMMQYDHSRRPDPFGLFGLQTTEEILTQMNISSTMAAFPPSIGMSENLDLEFCRQIWIYNYINSPLMPKKDTTEQEEKRFKEMQLDELQAEFKAFYTEFRNLNLVAIYHQQIAEIQMGFIARISNLGMDVIDFVRMHKGETAELVTRSNLETYIVASWLLKRKDPAQYQRFREYSTGREKFMAEKLMAKAKDEKMKGEAKKIAEDAIKDAGVRDIQVAAERGDAFEIGIDKMVEEVWGQDNEFYFLYKRSSEVTHGHWRTIAQYHLAKSFNPMHNGLYWYNDNPNHFSGLTPAFMGLMLPTNYLLAVLDDINDERLKGLHGKLQTFSEAILDIYMQYYKKYILKDQDNGA